MSMPRFRKSYTPRPEEFDAQGILKPCALLHYLEDIASQNANDLNFGYKEVSSKNCAWFLLKYSMSFENYPQNISSLSIDTESKGANKLFAYRDFWIYDEASTLLGCVSSVWGVIDLSSKSMLNPLSFFDVPLPRFERGTELLPQNKIPALQNITSEHSFSVQQSDIDVNEHVNNAIYMQWALDSLNPAFLEGKKLARLDIHYKKEVLLHQRVLSQVEQDASSSKHSIRNAENSEELCQLHALWQ